MQENLEIRKLTLLNPRNSRAHFEHLRDAVVAADDWEGGWLVRIGALYEVDVGGVDGRREHFDEHRIWSVVREDWGAGGCRREGWGTGAVDELEHLERVAMLAVDELHTLLHARKR